jgi:hypothetical protein
MRPRVWAGRYAIKKLSESVSKKHLLALRQSACGPVFAQTSITSSHRVSSTFDPARSRPHNSPHPTELSRLGSARLAVHFDDRSGAARRNVLQGARGPDSLADEVVKVIL